MVLPPLNFRAAKAGFVTLGYAADYVKDLPFTGMAVYTPWARTHVDDVKRLLAATDQSIAWLADPSAASQGRDRSPGREVARQSSPDDAEVSYDLLPPASAVPREPSSKVSRAKLQNLIDVERCTPAV